MTAVSVGESVASTLRNRRKNLADNVSNHNSLLRRLEKRGGIREVADGGRTIFEPIMGGNSNASAQFYTDTDTFSPPTTSEVFDGAEYNWKQLGVFVHVSGLDKIKNSGPARLIDLLEARIKQAEAQLRNTASTSLYSDGTGSSSKEFGGLQLIVADDPTAAGSVGGINQVTWSFWRNQYSASAATTSATIQGRMNSMWLSCIRNKDKPNLILADDDMYKYYWESLTAIQRITTTENGESGFASLKYMSADVEFDDACPNKHMYFLCLDSLAFRYARDHWFDAGAPRQVTNADYEVVPIWVAGNWTVNNRSLNGVIIAS